MSDMLKSIGSDLTSRRMLPLLVLALGLFAGAVAYAALGGKVSSSPVAASKPVKAPDVPGPSVSSAPANPHDAVAETTSGTRYQHSGHVRNPFSELPGSKEASATSESGVTETSAGEASTSGSADETSESGASESTPSGSTPGEPTPSESTHSGAGEAPPEPVAQSTVYEASLTLKRVAQPGTKASLPQTFVELASLQPLPSKQKTLLAYAGSQSEGKGALFLLVMPAIVHGKARCLPSAAACESIYLEPKQSEELQYLQAGGNVVSYELAVKQIASKQVPASAETEKAARLVVQERTQLEKLGVALPAKVHFSQEVVGDLTGIGEALSAAKQAEASKKQAGSGESGTSGSRNESGKSGSGE